MSIKERTRQELKERIDELESIIAEKGVGAGYLKNAERAQRNVNIALVFGALTAIGGIAAWVILGSDVE